MAVVGTPRYFAARGIPQTPQELVSHNCINLRLASAGGLYPWEFEKDGRELHVRVDGQFTFNTSSLIRKAARAGLGLASIPIDQIQDDLATGVLVRVLADWCPPFAGYHLYYPSRRQNSLAFRLLVNALRSRV
jgi:DNA-binding transcriptional LysR family regulator